MEDFKKLEIELQETLKMFTKTKDNFDRLAKKSINLVIQQDKEKGKEIQNLWKQVEKAEKSLDLDKAMELSNNINQLIRANVG